MTYNSSYVAEIIDTFETLTSEPMSDFFWAIPISLDHIGLNL